MSDYEPSGQGNCDCGLGMCEYYIRRRFVFTDGRFFPCGEDNFFDLRPAGAISESRPNEPVAINMFEKRATCQSRTFADVYDGEHLASRAKSILDLDAVREDHPKVFAVEFLVDARDRMGFDFAGA